MFFYIGDNCPLSSLKQVEQRLFLDDGWNHKSGIWYKGYSTECVLSESLENILGGYQPAGKWCVIRDSKIYHPILRGFPLYNSNNLWTNLKLDNFVIKQYDTPEFPDTDETLTLYDASLQIGNILIENTENLYKYNEVGDMTVVFSAGLDTLTVWSVLDQVTKNYTVSIYVPSIEDTDLTEINGTERTYASDLLHKTSEDYWGYHHACFYTSRNWNITGYYAEVNTYRDAAAINAIANYYGRKIHTFANTEDYLYWFLRRPNLVKKYKNSMLEFSDELDFKKFLWSTIWYDHQMWHLDNNMMFSPFADIRIPMIMNKLSIEDLAKNAVSGIIQRKIIERFRPDLLPLLSDYKNEKDIWKNFKANFNESMIHPNTKLIYR